MKITTVLTAVNNNPKYTRFIPLFIFRWNVLYPGIRIKIIFIGNSIPRQYTKYSEYFELFPEIKAVNSVYIAQTIRLLYPALLGPNETVVITDIDMLPGNRSYFRDTLLNIEDNVFLSMRPLRVVMPGQIAMCYAVAKSTTWSNIFSITSLEDITNFLIKNYIHADGKHGGKGWYQDQMLLRSYVDASEYTRIHLDDSHFKRYDVAYTSYSIPVLKKIIASEAFSDIHIYSENCKWTENDIDILCIH